MARIAGLEPATSWLTARRSTIELYPNNLNKIILDSNQVRGTTRSHIVRSMWRRNRTSTSVLPHRAPSITLFLTLHIYYTIQSLSCQQFYLNLIRQCLNQASTRFLLCFNNKVALSNKLPNTARIGVLSPRLTWCFTT